MIFQSRALKVPDSVSTEGHRPNPLAPLPPPRALRSLSDSENLLEFPQNMD